MKVELLHHTPLWVCAHAVRTCWQSHAKGDSGGPKDRMLIEKVGNKYKHSSTLEHLTYNFYIQGVSRALLQELARHRIASLSVKSTRYTLKELAEIPLNLAALSPVKQYEVAEKYCVMTGNALVDKRITQAFLEVQCLKLIDIPNDIAKFALPDAYKTEFTWSINARSLQNFLYLRTSKSAMWEIRKLANGIFKRLPENHKYLFLDSLQDHELASADAT